MIDLVGLEQAPAAERVKRLIDALVALDADVPFAGVAPADGYRRLASAYAAILSDPAVEPTADQLSTLMLAGGVVNSLFAAAGLEIPARAVEVIAPGFDGRVSSQPPAVRRRLFALQTLDTPGPLDVEDGFEVEPEAALVRALAFVHSRALTPLGAERREQVLAHPERLAGLRLPPTLEHVALASAAWMTCSYSLNPERHALKPALNGLFRRLLGEIGLAGPALPAKRPRPERPTIVVIAEVMHAQHVQFRYFGQYLRQLRSRFRLVLVAAKEELGPEVAALFDETFGFEAQGAAFLGEVVGYVSRLAPDIVFWPSVGMARWGPFLANLRLAPIQMTALGHSASTFIPEMDYFLTEEGYVSDPALFSERLLLLPDESLRFERPPGYVAIPPQVRAVAEPVKIAVPSNMLKLRPGFLALLQRVRAGAPRPVELHLFPSVRPLQAAAFRTASPYLEGAVAHGRMPAPAYLAAVNACDLVLSPFPFGGLHSVVDALRQGLPVVAMEGAEPHARTDAMILRRLGMPEWLIAKTEDEYVAAALRLIGDDALRVELSEAALACDVDRVMFADASSPLRSEVVDAVWAAYEHHERILADPRRAWGVEELRNLGAAAQRG